MAEAPRKAYRRDQKGEDLTIEINEDEVKFLLMDREQFRLDKNFKEADKIRDQIEEMGVKIDDKGRTWAAIPKPEDKAPDLNSASVTAALTLHPVVWISGFGEHEDPGGELDKALNKLFKDDFPGAPRDPKSTSQAWVFCVSWCANFSGGFPELTFRMAREKLDDDGDDDGLGLESIISRETMSTSDPDEVKKVGRGLGYGTVNFMSAEQAKDFIYRKNDPQSAMSRAILASRIAD